MFFLSLIIALAYVCFFVAKKRLGLKFNHQEKRIKISNYSRIDHKVFLCLISVDSAEYLLVSNNMSLLVEKLDKQSNGNEL